MTTRPAWTDGPFEVLLHAELHRLRDDDSDRRIALILFDNAIELAITSYLSLHPTLRSGREYEKKLVERWLTGFHEKLDLLDTEPVSRGRLWFVDRNTIIWCHDNRNTHYHGRAVGVPDRKVLELARQAAVWVFGELYEIDRVEGQLEDEIVARSQPHGPQRTDQINQAIDDVYDKIDVCGQVYSASEVLFAVDPVAYVDLGGEPGTGRNDPGTPAP